MIKKYRLEFISKKPASLKSAWRDLIDAGLITSNLGVLTGSFFSDSPELSRVIEYYERDKEKLNVRMESSCQVTYDQNDFESHAFFKLYPPDIELVDNEQRTSRSCEECGRTIGCDRHSPLTWAKDVVVPKCAVAMTTAGDLLLRDDLVEQIRRLDGLNAIQLDAAGVSNGTAKWFIVMRAPVTLRVGTRVGFCQTCGGAEKSDALPEVDETYSGDTKQNFILSPDQPSLPCFSTELVRWLIDVSSCLSWEHFKPVTFEAA